MFRRLHRLGTLALLSGLLLSLVVAGLPRAQAQGPGAQGPPKKVDVLIGFHRPPGADEHRLVRANGGAVRRSFTIVPAVAATLPEHALAGLAQDRRVAVIEPDGEFHAIDHGGDSGDPELDNTWGVKHIGSGLVHVAGHLGRRCAWR